jgi:ubiquitin-protein ligase
MPTPQEQRSIRLMNDYVEMTNIRGPVVQWRPVRGTAPYVEAYELTVNVRTIVGSGPDYRVTHVIRLELPPNYPFAAPEAVMSTRPQPYHPNWFTSGRWCFGTWDIAEGLGHYVVRMIQTLQFDEKITNPNSPANGEAKSWYLANRNRGRFPTDQQVLPDPTKGRFEIVQKPVKKFRFE